MELRHKNWQELAQFCRDFNDEFLTSQGKVKDPYKWLSPSVTEAVRQFMIEVNEYGLGLSNMSAETWFNEPDVRKGWADTIANLFEAYQKSLEETPLNPVAEELKALQTKLDEQSAELKTMREAMMDKKEMMDKKDMAAMHGEEEAGETDDSPEEEAGEDATGKKKGD